MYAPQAAAASAITFDNKGFIINGQRTWVSSGEIHYPRVPEELWLDRLLRLKRAGLNCVQTYAFPNYHWTGTGYAFTGNGDLNQYLQDIESLGLYATVRVGLYDCAEWDNGGYPEWLLLEPGVSLREATPAQFLTASDQWYDQALPIVAANQINKGGPVIFVQLDNEHPACWGVDYDNLTYFQHLLSTALTEGIQVPMWFSGLHHSADPAGTTSWNSTGREDPWYADEFWAGWFNQYGDSGNDLTTIDRGTWKIIAYGGGGYNYYMFHGGSNFDHWPSSGIGPSYDYGAACGQAGDLRTLYYRDKRSAWFARTFQSILENYTNADSAYTNAATGVTAINARTSPAGTIVFLDNNTANTVTATLADGDQIELESEEIAPVVENYALTNWLTINEADARIFGARPQGAYTTLVEYGLPGETVHTRFGVTSGTVSYADPEFIVSGSNVSFSAPVVDGTSASFQLTSGTNTLRLLVMSKTVVDRTWFVDASGTNYVVNGPDYVGAFSDTNGQINCTLEEPLGSPLPTTILAYGPDAYAPHTLTIASPVATGTPATPPLLNWQMRSGTGEAAVGYNDSGWYTTATPALMGADGDYSNYAWYRAQATVAASGTYYLGIPPINDWGMLFVNGKMAASQLGASGSAIPVALQSGSNTVAFFAAHYGRNSFYSVTGTSANGFSPKGLQGQVSVGGTPLTSWYWLNTGTTTAPTAATIAQVTGTGFNPAANGWSTGTGWNGNVLTGAGYAFFQTTLPALASPQSVFFTNVEGSCTVYLNGTNVAGTGSVADVPFSVPLGSYWKSSGSNVLTVLVQDTSGDGGIPGAVIANPISGAIPAWKLQGGIGTIEGTGLTWENVGTTGSTPTFYHATFQNQQAAGINAILRAGYAGLSSGHIWLNGHALGRYPEVIPISGIYLPECWLSATNTIDYFDEQGAAPTSASLFVETAASRQVYQAQDVGGAMVYPPESVIAYAENGKVSLSWSAVAGATGYNVMRSAVSGGPYTVVESNVQGLSFVDTEVTNGNTYYYVIAAENAGSETPNSTEVSATPILVTAQFTNPGFELPGTGKIASGFATIPGWTDAGSSYANSGVETSPASHGGSYHAFCKGSDSGAYQITNYQLQLNDQVTLTWWAEHTGGSGGSTQSVSLLSAPSASAAYASTTALTSTTGAVNGYGSSSGPWTQYTLTYNAAPEDVGNFVGVYFNNTTSSNWSGFDDFSISVASAPYPPLALSATDGNASVGLNWAASGGATSYNLKRGTVSGTYPTVIGVSGTSYVDSAVTNGTTYYYVVSAINGVGEGANSDQISGTPSLPVTTTEASSGQFTLGGAAGSTANVVFKNSVPGHTYTIQYCANITNGTWTNIGTAIAGTGGNIQFPPFVINGTQGFYRIVIQRE
jgi:beta-galactosidase